MNAAIGAFKDWIYIYVYRCYLCDKCIIHVNKGWVQGLIMLYYIAIESWYMYERKKYGHGMYVNREM